MNICTIACRGKLRTLKIDLDGNIVMEIPNGNTGEIQGGVKVITVAPDGSICISMGYGSNLIPKFDKAEKLLKTFGGCGNEVEKSRPATGLVSIPALVSHGCWFATVKSVA